jgi:predicted dehydrogenase
LSKALAGGPLGDVGVYCINATRYLSGEEPAEVTGYSYQPSDEARFTEVPRDVVWTMRFPSGITAHCGCSFGSATTREFRVSCADGTIEMANAFGYSGQKLTTITKGQKTEHEIGEVNHFAAEMDHFSECVMENKDPKTPGEEGLADMKVVEAIEEAARTGKKVAVS